MRPASEADALTLFCLAHAGGSAAPYRSWESFLPTGCRVVPLELPGHGTRLREPLASDLEELVDGLVPAVGEASPERFAIFGHSFGSLLAFELTRRLCREGRPPVALLVAGRDSPSGPPPRQPLHTLSDERLVTELSRCGGIPREMLDMPELLDVYLPAIRRDLTLTETYTRPPGPAMRVPLTVYAGRRDRLVDLPEVFGWVHETTSEFEMVVLSGGHFPLTGDEFRSHFADRLWRLAHARESPHHAPAPPGNRLAPSAP